MTQVQQVLHQIEDFFQIDDQSYYANITKAKLSEFTRGKAWTTYFEVKTVIDIVKRYEAFKSLDLAADYQLGKAVGYVSCYTSLVYRLLEDLEKTSESIPMTENLLDLLRAMSDALKPEEDK